MACNRIALSFVFVFSLVLLGGCGATDEERLQGDWHLHEMAGSYLFGLQPFRLDDREVLTFNGNSFSFRNNTASDKVVKGTFVCDNSKKPNRITFSIDGKNLACIFELSGDELRICVGEKDELPPREFVGGPESRPALMRFKRK